MQLQSVKFFQKLPRTKAFILQEKTFILHFSPTRNFQRLLIFELMNEGVKIIRLRSKRKKEFRKSYQESEN